MFTIIVSAIIILLIILPLITAFNLGFFGSKERAEAVAPHGTRETVEATLLNLRQHLMEVSENLTHNPTGLDKETDALINLAGLMYGLINEVRRINQTLLHWVERTT